LTFEIFVQKLISGTGS